LARVRSYSAPSVTQYHEFQAGALNARTRILAADGVDDDVDAARVGQLVGAFDEAVGGVVDPVGGRVSSHAR
jgi:hypothetical protein